MSSPDLLLTLALGGDHLEDGVGALKTAMADATLAPHFAVVEAKRLGRRFGSRKADPKAALAAVGKQTVMSASEVRDVAEIAEEMKKPELKKVASDALSALRQCAKKDKSVAKAVEKLVA